MHVDEALWYGKCRENIGSLVLMLCNEDGYT